VNNIYNDFFVDDAPLNRNIRGLWGILLFVNLLMIPFSRIIQIFISEAAKFLIRKLSNIIKKIIRYKPKPHQIKSDVYEAAEKIMRDMHQWEQEKNKK
jgi:hypothetical protein